MQLHTDIYTNTKTQIISNVESFSANQLTCCSQPQKFLLGPKIKELEAIASIN